MEKDNKNINIEEQQKVCKDCLFYWGGIYCCGKEENEGIRVFENTEACKYFESKIE